MDRHVILHNLVVCPPEITSKHNVFNINLDTFKSIKTEHGVLELEFKEATPEIIEEVDKAISGFRISNPVGIIFYAMLLDDKSVIISNLIYDRNTTLQLS